MGLDQNVQIILGGVAVSEENPLPVSAEVEVTVTEIEAIGAKDDAAVTDPALAASSVALLKGLLTALATLHTDMVTLHDDIGLLTTATSDLGTDIGTVNTSVQTLTAVATVLNGGMDDLNSVIGVVADAAVSTPDTNGTLIALTKGVITLNQPAG